MARTVIPIYSTIDLPHFDANKALGQVRYELETYVIENGVKKTRAKSGPSPNLVTNLGLDHLAVGNTIEWCRVARGTTPPTPSDTDVVDFVAASSLRISTNYNAAVTPPYFGYMRRVYRFTPGQAGSSGVNLGSVALSYAPNNGACSHSLIRDYNMQPTVLPWLPEEYLDVTADARLYAPTDTRTTVHTVNGVETTFVVKPALVDQGIYWNPISLLDFGADFNTYGNAFWACAAFSGSVSGSLTGMPSGTLSPALSWVTEAYVPGSYQKGFSVYFGLDEGNFLGVGIHSLLLMTNLGAYQISVDPPIMKQNIHTLSLTFNIPWEAMS